MSNIKIRQMRLEEIEKVEELGCAMEK